MKFFVRKKFMMSLCVSAPLALLVSCTTPLTPAARPVHNEVRFSGDYIDVAKCDTMPTAKFQVPPRYPVEFRRAGISGRAVVWFIVELDGSTSSVQVQDATSVEFGEAARAAVAQWKFVPGRKAGQPVRSVGHVEMPFTISEF